MSCGEKYMTAEAAAEDAIQTIKPLNAKYSPTYAENTFFVIIFGAMSILTTFILCFCPGGRFANAGYYVIISFHLFLAHSCLTPKKIEDKVMAREYGKPSALALKVAALFDDEVQFEHFIGGLRTHLKAIDELWLEAKAFLAAKNIPWPRVESKRKPREKKLARIKGPVGRPKISMDYVKMRADFVPKIGKQYFTLSKIEGQTSREEFFGRWTSRNAVRLFFKTAKANGDLMKTERLAPNSTHYMYQFNQPQKK
jgi:hypothetical protein